MARKNLTLICLLAAQMRWEAKIPELAQTENLANYITRVNSGEKGNINQVILTKIKALYCYFRHPT